MRNIWKNRDWKPMLLEEIDKPFDSDKYIFEIKFDGIRAIIFVSNENLTIQSRNNKNITHLFPELQNIKKEIKDNVIFDGEIVIFDKNKVSFSKVQERLHIKNKNKILSLSKNSPAIFIVFDILYKNKDLTNLELLRRKKILSKYQDNDYFVKTKFIEEKGVNFFKNIKKMKLEGMVAKLKEGKYYINKRTDNFIKIKNLKREEFLIGGYEYKKNDILSISLGEYIENKFHFVGKVSINKNKQIYNKLLNSKKSKNYFFDYDQNITYIKPVLKCNIEYLERTKNNHLRHPIYKE